MGLDNGDYYTLSSIHRNTHMKEQLETQIKEIAQLSDKTNQLLGLDVASFVEQKKTLMDLAKYLTEELNQLDFEFFEKIMEGEEYDTEIHYHRDTRPECNRILLLQDEEELPNKFDRTRVYLKKRRDGTIDAWWGIRMEKKEASTQMMYKKLDK